MRKKLLPSIHPGEILREEFMKPLNLSANALAQRLGVTTARVNEIANERRGITADTALRLARVLGMSADFWLGLQVDWDLWHAMHSSKASEIHRLEPLRTSA